MKGFEMGKLREEFRPFLRLPHDLEKALLTVNRYERSN
jgi:hypothetical protein